MANNLLYCWSRYTCKRPIPEEFSFSIVQQSFYFCTNYNKLSVWNRLSHSKKRLLAISQVFLFMTLFPNIPLFDVFLAWKNKDDIGIKYINNYCILSIIIFLSPPWREWRCTASPSGCCPEAEWLSRTWKWRRSRAAASSFPRQFIRRLCTQEYPPGTPPNNGKKWVISFLNYLCFILKLLYYIKLLMLS